MSLFKQYFTATMIRWFTCTYVSMFPITYLCADFIYKEKSVDFWFLPIELLITLLLTLVTFHIIKRTKYIHNIYADGYYKASGTHHKEATIESIIVSTLIFMTLVVCLITWFFPDYSYWSNWVVGIFACSIANSSLNDKKKSSYEKFGLCFTAILFVLIILFYGWLCSKNPIIDKINSDPNVFIIRCCVWFSFGALSSFTPYLFNRIKTYLVSQYIDEQT